MIADENYVHLRRGGMLHFVGPTGMDCYATLDCTWHNTQWPKLLHLSHSPDSSIGNAKHSTWIDATGLADWLNNTKPFTKLERGQKLCDENNASN